MPLIKQGGIKRETRLAIVGRLWQRFATAEKLDRVGATG